MKINWRALFWVITAIVLLIGAGSRCSPSHESLEPEVKLYLSKEDKVITLGLEDYLIGVVGAEMPASFGAEALKAQAVTARTYTLKRLYIQPKHPQGAQMCDDITCCQAFIDKKKYEHQYGKALYKRRFVPVTQAVRNTRGQVILYDNQLIDTPYFSTCGGETASAQEVWGKDVAYLKSVKCTFCKESKRFNNTSKFSLTRVNQILHNPRYKKFDFQIQAVTASGRLRTAKVNGEEIKGQELRRLFSLTSTQIISARQIDREVIFQCRGYGHGVGLCQYGADGMARKGYSYQEILGHYYQGITLTRLNY